MGSVFDQSDSYILFVEERGYHRWELAHSSSCLLLVRTLYGMTKFMICSLSEHCMVWPSLWFATGQYTVCYDQLYDLFLVRTLYGMTKFMICYWSVHCMLRSTLWFVTGPNAVCYDQVNDYTPSLRRGSGVYCFTSFRPSKIFFVTFFSLTVDGRNLIFGHKHHIGIPCCG